MNFRNEDQHQGRREQNQQETDQSEFLRIFQAIQDGSGRNKQ